MRCAEVQAQAKTQKFVQLQELKENHKQAKKNVELTEVPRNVRVTAKLEPPTASAPILSPP